MDAPQIMKKLDEANCPNCHQKIYIASQTMPAFVFHVASEEETIKAKEDIIEGIKKIIFVDEEEQQKVINWASQPTAIFDSTDVEPLLQQFGEEQTLKASSKIKEE